MKYNILIMKALLLSACFVGASSAMADGLFNMPSSQTPQVTDFYGNPLPVYSAEHFNQVVAQDNKQSLAALKKQPDDQSPALAHIYQLQQKMLADDSKHADKPVPNPPARVYHPHYKQAKPDVIYHTPTNQSQQASGGVANFSTGASGNNTDAGNSGGLGIQY